MNIEKIKLADIKRCYCASSIQINNKHHILLASEDPNVGCYKFSGDTFDHQQTIWKEAGGCMSIIPIPNKEGQFLAVQEFYLKVTPSLSKIVWGNLSNDEVVIKDVLSLPFLHRFDIFHKNGVNYFIGATIATSKKDKEDWSVPGRIYVGVLPEDPSLGIELSVLVDGLYRNHGYWHGQEDGNDVGYFGSDQGILKVTPPESLDGTWSYETIIEGKIGEIATIDIDGDGEMEIMTIEPFHGNTIKIYHKENNAYKEVYKYEQPIDFAHTLVGTTLCGIPTFLAGVRREEAELFYVQFQDGKYETKIIEKGVGPANLAVVHEGSRDIIIAANHTKNEGAIYVVTK